MRIFVLILAIMLMSACTTTAPMDESKIPTPPVLKKASFDDLPGWEEDDLKDFITAYEKSCARILKRDPSEAFSSDPRYGTYGAWQESCKQLMGQKALSTSALRAKIESLFDVYAARDGSNPTGLFTGYYESTLRGSRTKGGAYQHPLLARPSDLVMVDLGEFREELKGQRIAGRVLDGRLRPYEDRAAIVSGKLPPEQFKPLVWLDNPKDAFFVQVQGSGVVHLDDGSIMRVGYDGQNGHVYYAIGRELVKRGIYTKDEVSMDSIRSWMAANHDQADDLMNTNRSYVFFREMPDRGPDIGPQGGEGVPLTPRRSIAIDRSIIPYGFPLWLDAQIDDLDGRPLRRLMMAQDTGGAIRGAVRGDVFWGTGEQAESKASVMKADGRYWFLLPKGVAP